MVDSVGEVVGRNVEIDIGRDDAATGASIIPTGGGDEIGIETGEVLVGGDNTGCITG